MVELVVLTNSLSVCLCFHAAVTCEVRIICLRLLACAAIRVGPADIVLDAVAKKIETENFDLEVDATTELEFHINSIVTSLSPKSSGGTAISGRDEVSKADARLL